tara:strand:+ start:882 stop:1115 length:234 start_codon:yes stop_codon:yes gene_type:complete
MVFVTVTVSPTSIVASNESGVIEAEKTEIDEVDRSTKADALKSLFIILILLKIELILYITAHNNVSIIQKHKKCQKI